MPNPLPTFQLSQPIVQQLAAVRRMLRRYVLAHGLLLVVLWLLLVFWLGGLVDYLPVKIGSSETPRWLRIGLLAAMAIGSAYIIVRRILLRLTAGLSDNSLALLIERRYPELNNELITAVELAGHPPDDVSNPTAHQAMLERVHASVSQRMGNIEPSRLFAWRPLWTVGVAAATGMLFTLVAVVVIPGWMQRWSTRLFALSDQPWPRHASLRADGIQLQVPSFSTQLSAERVMIPFVDQRVRVPTSAAAQLQISADTSARQVPEVCTLFYRSADGARGRANLRRVGSPRDGWQQFTLDGPPLDGLAHDMVIDVVGLDARLRDLSIEVVEPAVISQMQIECVYPSYLLDSFSTRSASETIAYRNGATLPEGTQISLIGSASSPLSRVEYLVHGPADNGAANEATLPAAPEIRSVQPQGKSFRIPLGNLTSTQVIEVRLIDQFGLSAGEIPRYVITMQADEPPEVNSQLEGIGLAVTPNAMLPVRGDVTDDHGIQQVEAELAVNDVDPIHLPLQLVDGQLQSVVDLEKLQAERELPIAAGATLGMVVTAQDFYDLGEIKHVGRGQAMQLAVVTADQLLVLLDRQELELRQRLELIIAELEQMREVLQTLNTELTPASSARRSRRVQGQPAQRLVALQDQAGAESRSEQVRRLSSLWAQQSVLQGDKSQQELSSVAARVDNLRLQLVNNRIDSYDRQERLLQKVYDPLRQLLAGQYLVLQSSLSELQSATQSGGGAEQAQRTTAALDAVLLSLEAIKASMQDIEDFNEIIDLVRGLLDDQEKVLTETEQQQQQRVIDLLK